MLVDIDSEPFDCKILLVVILSVKMFLIYKYSVQQIYTEPIRNSFILHVGIFVTLTIIVSNFNLLDEIRYWAMVVRITYIFFKSVIVYYSHFTVYRNDFIEIRHCIKYPTCDITFWHGCIKRWKQ